MIAFPAIMSTIWTCEEVGAIQTHRSDGEISRNQASDRRRPGSVNQAHEPAPSKSNVEIGSQEPESAPVHMEDGVREG